MTRTSGKYVQHRWVYSKSECIDPFVYEDWYQFRLQENFKLQSHLPYPILPRICQCCSSCNSTPKCVAFNYRANGLCELLEAADASDPENFAIAIDDSMIGNFETYWYGGIGTNRQMFEGAKLGLEWAAGTTTTETMNGSVCSVASSTDITRVDDVQSSTNAHSDASSTNSIAGISAEAAAATAAENPDFINVKGTKNRLGRKRKNAWWITHQE